MLCYHSIRQFSSTRLSMALYSFLRGLRARNNTRGVQMSLRYIKIGKYVQLWEVRLSRRITSFFNEHIEATRVQLDLSYGHTRLCTYYIPLLPPFSLAAHFPVQEGPYITVYNTSATTVVNFFSLSLSPQGFPVAVQSTCVLVYLERSPIWARAESRLRALSVAPLINCPLTKTENQMRDKGKRRDRKSVV